MKRIRAELIAYVGGAPSATQRLSIERIVRLSLHLELLDERIISGTTLDERSGRQYLAWSNAVARLLRSLKPAAARPGAALEAHRAAILAQRAAGDAA